MAIKEITHSNLIKLEYRFKKVIYEILLLMKNGGCTRVLKAEFTDHYEQQFVFLSY
jgi:hypothetical protein